jgi:thioredoxin 1
MLHPRISALFLAASAALPAQFSVPALNPAELAQIRKSGKWTVIEFGGPTCVPCRKMQPTLAELQRHFGNRAQIRNFYVTEYPREAQAHKIMAMPTQVAFDSSGHEVARHIGFWGKGEFLVALAKAGLK